LDPEHDLSDPHPGILILDTINVPRIENALDVLASESLSCREVTRLDLDDQRCF
jgi:hypothetical protein